MRACRGLSRVLWAVCASGLLWACGGDDGGGSAPDAGSDAATVIDGSPACSDDGECDDGVFCNGEEFCDEMVCKRGAPVRCDDGVACTTDACSDQTSSCRFIAPDFDGDGHADAFCQDAEGEPLGDDCDDDNAERYPGNIEVCDSEGVDEDCNAATFGTKDQDKDGAIDAACCNTNASSTRVCGEDCDDLKASVNPEASEVCDLFDNDCDGRTDEEGAVEQYPDADYDGHGDEDAEPSDQCAGTLGFSVLNDDCNDDDPTIHAAQVEICDAKDNDCDERTDEQARAVVWYRDADGDGFGGRDLEAVVSCVPPAGYDLRGSDCNDVDAMINPAAAERCDGIDNNCDLKKTARVAVNDFEDDDNDGSADFGCEPAGNDCDDNNGATGGNLVEICDKLDNDCDELIDEEVSDTVWYLDNDGDGFGNERLPAVVYCAPLAGRSAYPGDCNDADVSVNPGAFEVCSLDALMSADEDCDGRIDEGFCPVCGDGVAEGPEQCDDRAVNSEGVCVDPDGSCNNDTLADACRTNCVHHYCDDGVTDSDEQCDDGAGNSDAPNANCRTDCTLRRCGDGIVDNGEACDDETNFCQSDCSASTWSDGICAPITADLGSVVGTNVASGDTGNGSNMIVFDDSDPLVSCEFTAGAPNGPEQVYTWQSPAPLLYTFAPSNAGLASRLAVGVFFSDPAIVTSCSEPWACLEPPAGNGLVTSAVPTGEGVAIVVDSASAQAYDLSIYPLLCCPGNTSPTDISACFSVNTQADLTCALAAVVPACLTNWTGACVTAADTACSYTCP